jgi:hypothetical protein
MENQTCDCQHSLRLLQQELDKERLPKKYWKKEAESCRQSMQAMRRHHHEGIQSLTERFERDIKEILLLYRDPEKFWSDEPVDQILQGKTG